MAAHHCIGTGADERRHWLSPDKAAALESTVQAIAVAGKGITFNQPLNKWNVSKVTNTEGMFMYANSFNQPLHAPWYA